MQKCGLLGKKLGHSYSPQIHEKLSDYEYLLYEKTEEELEGFLREGDWDGLNVTIPYKKSVIPFCDRLSDTASETGSVNTLVRDENGLITGHNTDVYGFTCLVRKTGSDPAGKKVLVLGNGGACASVVCALKRMGALPVVISRRGEDNYQNLDRHADAEMIVNTTPVGMYPETGKSVLDPGMFPKCRTAVDIIYNPARTEFLRLAGKAGCRTANGLYMLTAQAKKSSELFTGSVIPEEQIDKISRLLECQMRNIILVGMPGCGKTTIADLLAKKTGRKVIDTDAEAVEKAGISIPQIMEKNGESGFRDLETEVIREVSKRSGLIIATGGGSVLREENRDLLRQNGIVVWIRRDPDLLPRKGRPLSKGTDLKKMAEEREPYYREVSDITVENRSSAAETVRMIAERMEIE